MKIRDRLKTLKYDPLQRISLDENLSKGFQRRPKVKKFISEKINLILREVYEPIGLWKQNPYEFRQDLGVVIDEKWSALNQADTNYTGHSLICNRCNNYLLNLYRKKGIESIKLEDEEFSYKNLIVFYDEDSDEQVIEKFNKIFKIVRYKKNEIFLHTSEFAKELINLYDSTMSIGDKAQQFYEKYIHDFFNDLISYKSTKGRGDFDDRKQGVDIWKKHKGYNSTDQVKSVCNVYDKIDYYLIDVSLSATSKCDYFVFVCIGKRILVFKNDKSKIVFTQDGVRIPKELLHKQDFYNE